MRKRVRMEPTEKERGDMETLGMRDIIGPIMIGPSSSHTAGALRIAHMARGLMAAAPVRVHFTLYGSFAHTGSGHGTDKALVAGMLGLAADDLAIRDSFALAASNGLAVSFSRDLDTSTEHPNTVDLHIVDAEGGTLELRGVSTGGGAAAIRSIDGVDVNITGAHTSIVVRQDDVKGVLAHIAGCLSDYDVNIATTRMYRTRRGDTAYTVMEVDGRVPGGAATVIAQHPGVHSVRIIPSDASGNFDLGESPDNRRSNDQGQRGSTSAASGATEGDVAEGNAVEGNTAGAVSPDADQAFDRVDFTSGKELLARCKELRCSLGEAFLARERALGARDGQPTPLDTYCTHAIAVMREAVNGPLDHPTPSMGGLIGGEARMLADTRRQSTAIVDDLTADAMEYALAALETNASMGRIVAAPTAGSSGVLPGVLFSLEKRRGFDDATLKRGLFAAGAVGYLIARNATVSGAEGGCQAEIGAAAAMAAAAAVEMAGGTPEQALDAAGNALTSLLGLVCDPVGGLVEVPCQKRNATAAATALVSAQIALAGVSNLVNFDETVSAMDAVGRSLPFELRESALGGIAATPSACAWCAARS